MAAKRVEDACEDIAPYYVCFDLKPQLELLLIESVANSSVLCAIDPIVAQEAGQDHNSDHEGSQTVPKKHTNVDRVESDKA